MRKFWMVMTVSGMLCIRQWAGAGQVMTMLSAQEAALHGGATHVATITHTNLTETGTNGTSMTNTTWFPVAGTCAVELVYMDLVTPFEYTTTNGLSSTTMKIGDGTDDDFFLASTELNVNGTEVYLKYAPPTAYTIATTCTSNSVNGTNFLLTCSATATAGELGRKVYTSADTVDFIFTPTGVSWALNDLDKGEVRVYFRVFPR